ncbi:ABC transporter ATP-binding protein [Amycolatopsis silviterrae]|uniref:ATP-binding cassette domain-containing protein n=1 Tax=Amycolatopsis silviterrae TaxID=1656914 RepID=A0ABW5HGP7_9PSEU
MPSAPAVSLAGVTRLFGPVPALLRVGLRIERGEFVLLRGPNGAGKSTLLRLLGTAISPTFGTGAVLGFDLVRERSAIRARTELLGHRARLYDELTAEENLRFVCRLHGISAANVTAALDQVGMARTASERVHGFSPGMRQRLALARLVVRAPELLLLDEPFAACDQEAKQLVEDIVGEARLAGRTVVLATHDSERPLLPDRVLRLAAGSVNEAARMPVTASTEER